MKKILVIVICFISVSFRINAQDAALPSFITDSLESYINKGLEEWSIPGLAVGIVKSGKVVYAKGFGVKSIDSNEPVDKNTLFMIGSNTKSFTAMTLALLDASEKLSLNDKVQNWMPEFRLRDTLASEEVNITDLLSHRIGFETFQGDFTYWSSNLTRAQVIEKMALIEAPHGFRTKWGYCNAAFVTAGELIPRVIERSWEETVRDSILNPLKMNQTLMVDEEFRNAPNLAMPHSIVNEEISRVPIANINNLAPAGSMSSNVPDLLKWLECLMNDGNVNSEQIFPAGAVQAIKSPASILGLDPGNNQLTHFYLYGLGLMINDRDGTLVYSHGGGVDGFVTQMMFIPEIQVGIVVLTNSDQNNFYNDLTNEIRDAFLGIPFQNHSSNSLARFEEQTQRDQTRIDSLSLVVQESNNPTLQLNAYTGNYTNEVYGAIDISRSQNQLVITFSNHPNLTATLEHLKKDTFLCTYSNTTFGVEEIPFEIDNNGVLGLSLKVADFIEYGRYDFEKTK